MTITKSFFFRWRGDKGVMHQILTNRASRVSVNETRLALLHCDVPVSRYDHISLYSTIKGPDCQKKVFVTIHQDIPPLLIMFTFANELNLYAL